MLRLPAFDAVAPASLDEAVALLSRPGARVIAGGTDILPNLKHRLDQPALLVSLGRIEALRRIEEDGDVLRIGAGATLSAVAEHELVRRHAPSLSQAAGLVASPLIRNSATLGGNVNLDTRCRYVNQTHFWRSAIGGCLKSEGDVCHVVPKGRSCVAAMSSDCVPVLLSLGASLRQIGPEGERTVAAADYYNSDGTAHTNARPGEITAEILVPIAARPTRAAYAKWTVRKSIDFPLVSVAMHFGLERDDVSAPITEAAVCVGVLAARPKLLNAAALVGRPLSAPETAAALGDLVFKQSKPLPNVPYEPEYRRKVLPVHARRALAALVARG